MGYHFLQSPPLPSPSASKVPPANHLPHQQPGSILSAPQNFGNTAGDKIQGALGTVGNPVGKGLETAAKPVGGIIEPVVGGLFRAPQTFGHASDHAEKMEKENEEDHRPIAGEEMTADNPLGLNQGGTK